MRSGLKQETKNKLNRSKEFKLDEMSAVLEAKVQYPFLDSFLKQLKGRSKKAFTAFLAIDQARFVFKGFEGKIELSKGEYEKLLKLSELLTEVDKFYEPLGGVAGYQKSFSTLLKGSSGVLQKNERYLHPNAYDLTQPKNDHTVLDGLNALDLLAEIYPVGGAGERLGLKDHKTGVPLPAAVLKFRGRTLLEILFLDLFAREYLFFKLFKKQIQTPVALMTSFEKDNHSLIIKLLEEKNWFGRKKQNFKLFTQPLVPMIDASGHWIAKEPFTLDLKPGGHGVIWKLAEDRGVFKWLKRKNRLFSLVRQINNPAAGVDRGLLAFYGIGVKNSKQFGIASCERLLNAPEGMNVLNERVVPQGFSYSITNVEYTDFDKKGLKDLPKERGSPYSAFPCNTNILFIKNEVISALSKKHPAPGLLINLKSETEVTDCFGVKCKVKGGRLETTMQNIADEIVDFYKKPILPSEHYHLKTFLTFNTRRKTLSVTKSPYVDGKPINGTPQGCDFELLQNDREVLEQYCHMVLPKQRGEESYLQKGPEFIFDYHPALGPLFSIIGQKIRKGELKKGSELHLEITEVDIENLNLEGSLIVKAENLLGSQVKGKVIFDELEGRCRLTDVTVKNKGILRTNSLNWWKRDYQRQESLQIILEGNAEFEARGVELHGDRLYRVPKGHRLRLYMNDGHVVEELTRIKSAKWRWNYEVHEDTIFCRLS